MTTILRFFLAAILCTMFFPLYSSSSTNGGKLKLWYNKPAKVWNEALPIGNGRLAAMIYGDPVNEKIQLNESSFWSGGPSNNNNTKALAALPKVRQLIFDGKFNEANTLIDQNITATQLHGSTYQVVGNLNLSFADHKGYTDYYRGLDLEKAIFETSYNVGGVTYTREVFASKPDQLIVVRLSASEAGKLSFSTNFNGPLQKSTKAIDANTLEMTGLSSTHEGVTGQVKFNARAKIINTGGTTAVSGSSIKVTNANEVIILISIATNFVDYKTLSADEVSKCSNYLEHAEKKAYSVLKSEHVSSFQNLFTRVHFDLGTSPAASFPTDVRIKNFSKTYDPALVAMYYQFGRYLLISSSQPGGQPANLQGLWNESTFPSWDSKYTININTEMNYWPAEKCNLSEMHEPLFEMIKDLAQTGSQTAKTMYGCDGWVVHHNTDLWRISGVVDFAAAGMWPMGGAWLSQHLFERYLYTGNTAFLDSVYPILKSACEFYQDFLVEEPKNKWLVVSPSISPENAPSGRPAVCAGTTMDNQLLFDLFTKTIRAAKILNKDKNLIADFQKILDKLPPMQIGKYGQLQEWMEDLDNPNDQHRHVSHLYGLFPSSQISPYKTPTLFDAARTSLNYRGDVSTGWSMGWKVNFWARFLDGNRARKLLSDQLTLVDPVNSGNNGGTYPNFFDAHPPFQIDGNFGCTAGIAEMLMQSYDGNIHVLPALPDDWKKSGTITGLRAYGGFEISFSWENGVVQWLEIKSNIGGNCRLRLPNELYLADGSLLKPADGENPNPLFEVFKVKDPIISPAAKLKAVDTAPTLLFDLPTDQGKTYVLVYAKSPVFQHASVNQNTPDQIHLTINEEIKASSRFEGFSVKVDNVEVAIDSVVAGEKPNQLNIVLAKAISKENEILLSYENGNVASKFEKLLSNFSDTLVENLLIGASPHIVKLYTSHDGMSVNAKFNMEMLSLSDLSDFSLLSVFNGEKQLSFTASKLIDNDSTFTFTLSEQVYADYSLYLNYVGTSVKSLGSGLLKSFTKMPIENLSVGLPLEYVSGMVLPDGKTAVLQFNKPLAMALNQESNFTIGVNGLSTKISEATIMGNSITLVIDGVIRFADVVTADYSPGNITAEDRGVLYRFANKTLNNEIAEPNWEEIPKRIEAENFIAQFGTQTETTGDINGNQNIGWIDTGDWLEYAINNTTSDSIFTVTYRVASPNGGGIITFYLDNEKMGTVSVGSTGGWQTYKSIDKDLLIKPGKHYLKLFVSNGGFNINYFEIKNKIPNGVGEKWLTKLKVYPNPMSKDMYIESADFIYTKVEIVNVKGETVWTNRVDYAPKKYFSIDLANGAYLVKISNDVQSVQKTILINNDK